MDNIDWNICFICQKEIIVEAATGKELSGGVIAVDDFSLISGSCPPSNECTFEDSSLCGWTLKNFGFTDWKRLNGQPNVIIKKPGVDHTTGTPNGFFLVTEYEKYKTSSPMSYLLSAKYPKTDATCFSFWYTGKNFADGYVSLVKNEKETTMFRRFANSMIWLPITFTVTSDSPYQIKFYAGKRAYYSIDDIMLTDGPCNSPGSCDFEQGLCFYVNAVDDEFDWLIGSGLTSQSEGPDDDHTSGTAYGQYLFISPSTQEIHETALLISEPIQTSGNIWKCLKFWYFMNGENVGSLHVRFEVIGQSNSTIWQLYGNQSANYWNPASVPFYGKGLEGRIHFIGVRGLDDRGQLAIDDITVTDDLFCITTPLEAMAWGCNFEGGMCNWTIKAGQKDHWSLTNDTGLKFAPPFDHTIGNRGKGNFMFMNSLWKKSSTSDKLISPPIITKNKNLAPYCLSFATYQHGHFPKPAMQISIIHGGNQRRATYKSSPYELYRWYIKNVQINVMDEDQVVFEGISSEKRFDGGGVTIDDIDLTYGDCKGSGACTFESPDACGWTAEQLKVKWLRKSASTLNGSILAVDHTYNTKYGHFMYIHSPGGSFTSSIRSHKYTSQSFATCVQFFYFIETKGKFDKLIVKIETVSGTYQDFEAIGNHNGWNYGQAIVRMSGAYTVIVIAKFYGSDVTMGIDDFSMSDECPPLGDCDFENGFCSYVQDTSEDDIDWDLGSGNTPGFRTGPHVDHTTNTTGGFYAFVDSTKSNTSDPKTAVIKSVLFEPTPDTCVTFWYNMFGIKVQALSVYMSGSPNGQTLLWELVGNQGDNWFHAQAPISSSVTYQILFVATLGLPGGDIAIDDILFVNEKCSLAPPAASPTVVPTTAVTTSIGPTTGNNQVDCNFEKDSCPNWKTHATRKEFEWNRRQGDTHGLGPPSDHTKRSTNGHFIYIDASSPAELNDTAWLTNENIDNKRGGCFEFWYYMYGENVGTLSLYSTIKGALTWQWFRSGTQDDQWKRGQIYIDKDDGLEISITFVGTRGNGYIGVIALDDFYFAVGKTCQYRECTFEHATTKRNDIKLQCGWTNDQKGDDFDWYIDSGFETGSEVGPPIDHTLGTGQGHYASLRSGKHPSHSKAKMVSQIYPPTSGQCFSFWYYMNNEIASTLTVYQRVNGTDTYLWKNAAPYQYRYWKRVLVNTKSLGDNYQIAIEGMVARCCNRYDIGIDDIQKFDEQCPLSGDCDFEDFLLCGYRQDHSDDFDWVRGRGSTKTNRTGPSTDHTRGDATGHYFYINSAIVKRGYKARLFSEEFPATDPDTGRCLQFWRHMYGPSIGTFNVWLFKHHSGSTIRSIIWTTSGDHGDGWVFGQAPVFSEYSYKLVFEAVVGTSQGDIAVDDISFNSYYTPCNYIPASTAPVTTTVSPITKLEDLNCDFHQDFCNWQVIDRKWRLMRYRALDKSGAGSDHTTGKGYFASSTTGRSRTTSLMQSRNIYHTRGTICFKFAYYMFGRDIYQLNVNKVTSGSDKKRLWSRSHDQGSFWKIASIELKPIRSTYSIEIEAIANGYIGYIDIDDIIVSDDSHCKLKSVCDFEDGMCDYDLMLAESDFIWLRSNGGSAGGPAVDHTTGSPQGSYLYVITGPPRKENDKAVISTALYPGSLRGCFNFWYHMKGKDIGSLVMSYHHNSYSEVLWSRTGDQGGDWNHGRFNMSIGRSYLPFSIYITAIIGKNGTGDIAIDDLWIDDEPCPHEGSCDFESQSFCGWKNLISSEIVNKWELGTSQQVSYPSYFPYRDHTKGAYNGLFAYIIVGQGDKVAQLISTTYPATNGQCLNFWYSIVPFRQKPSNISIYMLHGEMDLLQTVSMDTHRQWYESEVGLYSRTEFQIIIQGISCQGGIAIDDIVINEGNCVGTCTSLPVTARVTCGPLHVTPQSCRRDYGCCYNDQGSPACFYHPSSCKSIPVHSRVQCGPDKISSSSCLRLGCCYTFDSLPNCYNSPVAPTEFPSTVAPTTTPAPSQFDCTFEHGMCNYTVRKNYMLYWQLRNSFIGDHTLGSRKGHFMSVQGYKRVPGKSSQLDTPLISFPTGGDNVCVRFWYNMRGSMPLNVYFTVPDEIAVNDDPIWTRIGSNVPRGWNYAQFAVPRDSPPFQISFDVDFGHGTFASVSIDDVSFVNGPCPPRVFCDFETSDICGWTQDYGDDFDWVVGYGSTRTQTQTRPLTDHTYQTQYGQYLYTGAADKIAGDKARVESFLQEPTDGSCVEFYYYMSGTGLGTLNIFVRRGDYVDADPSWTLSGDQGGMWYRAYVNVIENSRQWKIVFEGVEGGNPDANIAIDDINFLPGTCPPKGGCDFEVGMCGYENVRNNSGNWMIGSPKDLKNVLAAPINDHTTGTSIGHFLYTASIHSLKKKSHVLSEKFRITSNYKWCLQFAYYMFGETNQQLNVLLRFSDKDGRGISYQSIFSVTGSHDDQWLTGKVNVTSGLDFRFVFEGIVPSDTDSGIVIDDIKVDEGICQGEPLTTPEPCAVRCKDRRTCVPSDKVCDFFPDCAQGRYPDDMSDEEGCDQCDFEKGYCRWKDDSRGQFRWNLTQGHPADNSSGPSIDHTKGTALGSYIYTDGEKGASNAIAVLTSPVIKQAHYTCTLTFWYFMRGGKYVGPLKVYVVDGDRLTLLKRRSYHWEDKWHQATVYINRRTRPFNIKFKVEWRQLAYGDVAIDDIKFENCTLPDPAPSCVRGHFLCRVTHACVPKVHVCDFTDDCGDGSDEENCDTGINSYRCDFEDDLCDWQSLDKPWLAYRFVRKTGAHNTVYGPFSDHTTGTVSGHYLASKYSTSRWTTFIRSHIASGPMTVSSQHQCQIRFYYYYVGRANKNFTDNSMFSVKTRTCTGEGCNQTYVWSTDGDTWHNWIRANVTLQSTLPFQVLFELQVRRLASLLIDDVSFHGCVAFNGTLPKVTPSPPPGRHCGFNRFYCRKDNKCILMMYKCDFIEDCSDGEDESDCGPCDFSNGMCGYKGLQSQLNFTRAQPTGTALKRPAVDHTSHAKNGSFALSQESSTTAKVPLYLATLVRLIQMPSQTCSVQFFYYFNYNVKSATLSVYFSSYNSMPLMFRKVLEPINQWQQVLLPVQIPLRWHLNITTDSPYVAIDDISFINCSFPRPGGSCDKNQFMCNNGACISKDQACNFVPDCRDRSDETRCSSYKEKCTFNHGICNWKQDQTETFDWTIGNGLTASSLAPRIDHTEGSIRENYLFANLTHEGAARMFSVVFKASPSSCKMRFVYNAFRKGSAILAVGYRTLNNSVAETTYKWEVPDSPTDTWAPVVVTFIASKPFQVIIEAAAVDKGLHGYAALDDISFTPECKPDPTATLPVQPPDECYPDIEFSCGDGQCIPIYKVCDFKADCANQADEATCPPSCDFESAQTCGWKNDVSNDMDWAVKKPLKSPFDHTLKRYGGHYLYLQADPDQEARFPHANLISPVFGAGSYQCSLSFWFYMYHDKVQDYNDAILNVLYKRDSRYTSLLHIDDTSGKTWKNQIVQLPRCPRQFNIIFQGFHAKKTLTDISIDDWSFDCTQKAPKTCDPSTHFRCEFTSQCIPLDSVCDMENNCCDGDDEDDSTCPGYTRYNFESGFSDWKQPSGHKLKFIIDSGDSTFATGPRFDHTFQESYAKYVYLDASGKKPGQTASIMSKTIKPTQGLGCNITVWYSMYGQDMGSLSMSTGVEYGKAKTQLFTVKGDQGPDWIKKTYTLSSTQNFQVIFVATIGSGPLSDIALDDIQFSPSCRLTDEQLPGSPTPPPPNPCKPLFQCHVNKQCIPRNQLCDFESDCPDGEDEGTAICGHPMGFEGGLGPWKNDLEEADHEFMLLNEKLKVLGGPKTDAKGDMKGSFAYLNVKDKERNTKAILRSPVFMNSYSDCTMNFSYYINGEDVGQLRISFLPNDTFEYTVLFDTKDTQGDQWIHIGIKIGRRRHPFTLNFMAFPGGGDGGIGLDEITFTDCGLPPKCSSAHGRFRCKNNRCIDKSKVCDLVDDCGDTSDEDPASTCANYAACTFENDKSCQFHHTNSSIDYYWTLNMGETRTANTGPPHDHTFQTYDGVYMYTETSDQEEGDKALIRTYPMHVEGNCKLTFYFFMSGKTEGKLNVYYAASDGSSDQKVLFHRQHDQGIGWKKALIDLSSISVNFVVIFEGIVGESYLGDTAIDDVIFSPGCVPSVTPPAYPNIASCAPDEFMCPDNGNCRFNKVKCDDKIDCKGGYDEYGCPGGSGGGGSKGERESSGSGSTAGIVTVAVLIILGVGFGLYWAKRRRNAHNFHVEYKSENFEERGSRNNERINPSDGFAMDDKMVTEFIHTDIHDPYDSFTDVPINDPELVLSNTTKNTYSSTSTNDVKDGKSIVNPFYQDQTTHSGEWDDGI